MERSQLVVDLLRDTGRTTAQSVQFGVVLADTLGLSPTDLECLTLLRELRAAPAGQLAELLGLTTGAITGVVDRLEAAGFVVRDSDPADRRRVIVKVLPERLPELDAAYQPLLEAASQALSGYSEAELGLVATYQRIVADLMQRETTRLKAERDPWAAAVGDLSAPLNGMTSARLEFANGISDVRIYAGGESDKLYDATFEGGQPSVRVQDGAVLFRYKRMTLFELGKHAGRVALNPAVAWTLTLRGGASKVTVDARGLDLRQLSIAGGVSRVDVLLGAPSAVVPVCLEGGVSRVRIQRPAAVSARLQLRGGANRLELDGRRFGAVGGEIQLASPGWNEASQRYDIEVSGGASRLEIGTGSDSGGIL